MKTSTIICLILATIFATVACVGLLIGNSLIAGLWWVAFLLSRERSEFTKPIPRKELWLGILIFVIFISLIVTLDVLHLQSPVPNRTVRILIAVPIWFAWMWMIYRRWQKEKGKADA